MKRQTPPDLNALFAAMPGLHILVDRDLIVVAATDAYLHATRTRLDEIVGRHVFDALSERPDDPHTSALRSSTDSLKRVLRSGRADAVPSRRYHVRAGVRKGGRASDEVFEERYWKSLNSPVFDENGAVAWIIHSLEDVTELISLRHRAAHPSPLTKEKRLIIDRLREANTLLQGLPEPLFELLSNHLTPVVLARDAVLIEPIEPFHTVYFPLEGLHSMIRRLEDGSSAEVALGGRDGMVGVSVFTKDEWEETEARVHVAGAALAIKAAVLREVFLVHPSLRFELEQFVPMLMSQMSVSVVCNARHTVDQRLARWLLTASARLGGLELELNQESVAMLLGIRRTGVSEALRRLAGADLIATARNRISIKNKPRLETRACECFRDGEAARERHFAPRPSAGQLTPKEIRQLVDQYSKHTGQRLARARG